MAGTPSLYGSAISDSLYLMGIIIQKIGHGWWEIVDIESAMFSIAEYGLCAIIAADDDETIILSCIKHIIVLNRTLCTMTRQLCLCCDELTGKAFVVEERLGLAKGLFTRNLSCPTRNSQTRN